MPTPTRTTNRGSCGCCRRRIAQGWDRWASSFAFDADDASLIATADSDGRGPIYRIPGGGSAPEQLTHDDFTYTHVEVPQLFQPRAMNSRP